MSILLTCDTAPALFYFFLRFQTCWTLDIRLEHELLNFGLGQMNSWESVILTHVYYWRPFNIVGL